MDQTLRSDHGGCGMLRGVLFGQFPPSKPMGLVVLAMSLVVSVSSLAQGVPKANVPKAGTQKAAEPKAEEHDTVGNSLAPGLMALVKQEIRDGLRTRGIQTDFQRFCSYTAMKLNSTAGEMRSEER